MGSRMKERERDIKMYMCIVSFFLSPLSLLSLLSLSGDTTRCQPVPVFLYTVSQIMAEHEVLVSFPLQRNTGRTGQALC